MREPFPVFLWMTFGINAYVTVLTMGRVWWITRHAGFILGTRLPRRYYAAVVESGTPYTTCVLLYAMFSSAAPHSDSQHILHGALVQVSGIAHALITVHLSLGHGVQDVETIVTMAQAEQLGGSSTPVLDTVFSTVGSSPPISNQTSQAPEDRATRDIESVRVETREKSAQGEAFEVL